MIFPKMHPLKTSRLVLRKLTMEDAPMYFQRLGSSEAVTRYMLFSPHRDMGESVASIQKVLCRYQQGRCYRWGITLREEDSLIGIIELLRFREDTNSCSFAYMLGEEYWGKGYGSETLRAVFDFAFREMKVGEILADHMLENPASGKAMQKAGMTFQRHLLRHYEKNGIWHDALEYRITRSQWLKIAKT